MASTLWFTERALFKACAPLYFILFYFFGFSTGLVRLYIAGLPLRSCRTIGAPSVQGSAQCAFFRFWLQQDSNPRPGDNHADMLPLRHFDPLSFKPNRQYILVLEQNVDERSASSTLQYPTTYLVYLLFTAPISR